MHLKIFVVVNFTYTTKLFYTPEVWCPIIYLNGLVTVGIFLFALLGYQKDASLIEVFLSSDLGLSPN